MFCLAAIMLWKQWLGHSICFVFMFSDGHMLMDYHIYPLLPSHKVAKLAFEVGFTLRCFYFIVLLRQVFCFLIESVAIMFVDVYYFFMLYVKHHLFDFWWSICNCDVYYSYVDPHLVESIDFVQVLSQDLTPVTLYPSLRFDSLSD